MTVPTISLRNIVSLLISFAVGFAMIYYAHEHLERELLRPDRSMVLITAYAMIGIVGVLVVPTIRDRVVPAARVGAKLVQLGRRATDPTAVIPDEKDLEGVSPTDRSGL